MIGPSTPEQKIASGHQILLAEQRPEVTPGAGERSDADAAELKEVSFVNLKPMPSNPSSYRYGTPRNNRHIEARATLKC